MTQHKGITRRPVAIVVPEEIDQHPDGPENSDEAGDVPRGALAGHKGVVQLPGENCEAHDREQNVEAVHPKDLLIGAVCGSLINSDDGAPGTRISVSRAS